MMPPIRHDELREMVDEIDEAAEDTFLTDWEINFIADIIDKDIRKFTFGQAAQIRKIYTQRIYEK